MVGPAQAFVPVPSITPELAEALGHLAAIWGHLEFVILCACADVADMPAEHGQAIFSQMNLRPRLEVWCLLGERRMSHQSDKAMLRDFRKRIEDLQPKRNKFVHGLWVKTAGGKQGLVWMNGGKDGANRIDYVVESVTAKDVDETARQALALFSELVDWWDEAVGRLSPSPYKRWPPF